MRMYRISKVLTPWLTQANIYTAQCLERGAVYLYLHSSLLRLPLSAHSYYITRESLTTYKVTVLIMTINVHGRAATQKQ